MEVSIDQLYTYLHCPSKYKFLYKDQLTKEDTEQALFKKAIHQTIYYFFYSVMNEQVPTLNQMKNKWAHTYVELFKPEIKKEHLLETRASHLNRKEPLEVKGFEMIHNFYHFNHKNPGTPIAVNHEYRLPIGDLVITGTFELIREIVDQTDGRRYIEIVDFKSTDRALDYFIVKNDISLTLASYAFRNLFKAEEDRTKYHYLNTGRDIIVPKTEKDFNRLEAIVNGISKGITEEIYYPRQTFMCRTCELKDVCDQTLF